MHSHLQYSYYWENVRLSVTVGMKGTNATVCSFMLELGSKVFFLEWHSEVIFKVVLVCIVVFVMVYGIIYCVFT